ncbi:MAG TPA: hypothetical protein VNW92_05130 [Polyangiaceae bacterium]|jgi:hypothetical protein|nr:hypothetical protein [Polyangiaceae bacterium]
MKHSLIRNLSALAVGIAITLAIPACQGGSEGDRCNPARAAAGEDECGSGLSCQQPTNCPENYCCPTNGTSSNIWCQTGCNGGDVSGCLGDSTQAYCADLCAKDSSQSFCATICTADSTPKFCADLCKGDSTLAWCMMSPAGGGGSGGSSSSGAAGAAGAAGAQ